jgi:hypothetical protein
MAKTNSNIINTDEAIKYGLRPGQVAGNITRDASLGFGVSSASIDGATPLVLPPAIVIGIHTPSMWKKKFPEMGRMLKVLWERHCKNWSGIDTDYTLETNDTPVGNDGQNNQTPLNVKRTQPSPSATFDELIGNLVWNFHLQWMKDISDPDTKAFASRMEDPSLQFMPSVYSGAIMVIQPDPSYVPENIIGASIISNMAPTTPGGALGMEKQIGQSKNIERAITYTGYLQHNNTTNQLGVEIAKKLLTSKIRFGGNRQVMYDGNVDKELANSGLSEELKNMIA